MPTHTETEKAYLDQEWGNFGVIFRPVIIGYNPESQPKLLIQGPPQQFEQNTFGSYLNTPHEFAPPWSWSYQPLEEIRDYFGDEVGMYFSWLGTYTKALNMSALFGITVQILQTMNSGRSVDKNPATLAYSVYVGLWSISFISAWGRRENELRFLWGTEGLSDIEEVRLAFIGEVIYNADTGKVTKQAFSQNKQLLKKLFSMLIVLLMMSFTILCATGAMLLRYLGETPDEVFSGSSSQGSIIADEEQGFSGDIRRVPVVGNCNGM